MGKRTMLIHFTDILAQWSLDSIKERVAVDSSGQSNNGIINGATLETGIISNAFKFDGTDDYISMHRVSLNNLTAWSIEAWVKPEGPGIIYSEGNPAVTLQVCLKDNNSIEVGTWDHNRTGNWDWFNTGANAIERNAWNHIVITLTNGGSAADSGVVSCYVNGVLVNSGVLGNEYNTLTKEAAIGGNIGVKSGQGLSPFKGCIDEVTLYGCALSAEEVLQNYQKR